MTTDDGRQPGATALPSRPLVLVVDDHQDSADSLAMLLQLMGHEARVAHDGPSALEIAEREHPDVLLLDIGLPGMNGYELARRLRELPDGARLRLIALSGFGQPDTTHPGDPSPFDGYLVKPAELDALEAALACESTRPSRDISTL